MTLSYTPFLDLQSLSVVARKTRHELVVDAWLNAFWLRWSW